MKKVMFLISTLAAVLVLNVAPALAQQGGGSDQYREDSGEPATVTFELTVEGEIPEGKMLGVETGIADAPAPVFCSTATFHTDLPRCEDGGTYTDTFDLLPAGSTLTYEYYVMDYDYGGIVETFAGDTITVSDGQTISATYQADDPDGEQVTLSGIVEKPEATAYQYGTHAISDQAQGYYALQSDTVNLDDYVGEQVTVYGTLVPGYEDGQIEGGPPLVEVTRVEPTEDPDLNKVTLSFELAVEGEPPAGTAFFGFIPAEGGISAQLTDPDGDGLYTGETDVPQYAPGPRPVPEDMEPVTLPIQIVQTPEVRYGAPLYPDVIEDFGEVLMDEDKTFSASISFEDTTDPDPDKPEPTTPDPGDTDSDGATDDGDSTDSPSDGDDSAASPSDSGDSAGSSTGIEILPDTGGVTLAVVGMIALLATTGLLFAGLLSTGLLRRR